jgi:hypothetical protein
LLEALLHDAHADRLPVSAVEHVERENLGRLERTHADQSASSS